MNIFEKCQQLLEIDSPSGFTKNIIEYLTKFAVDNKLDYHLTNKGNLVIDVIVDNQQPELLIASHVDTLGLMVGSVSEGGLVKVYPIGSPIPSTLNGEYGKLYTRNGDIISGTILLESNSKHVFKDSDKQVEFEDLYFRLDRKVSSKQDVYDLGIKNGDFICYDPKVRLENGFLNSRFLDDKLCVGICLELLEQYVNKEIEFKQSLSFAFSTYEEVGHGLSFVSQNIKAVIALDMGCVGENLSGSEYAVSICAKDSSGPYDYDMTSELVNVAIENKLDYALDVYPFYGSDASSALRGGNDIKACLLGPGIAASHGMERAHINGVNNTLQLLIGYLTKKR